MYTKKVLHFVRTQSTQRKVLTSREQKVITKCSEVSGFLRTVYGNDANFICGYEAGCLGYTLYHQLTEHDVNCVILAPTTMLEQRSKEELRLTDEMQK